MLAPLGCLIWLTYVALDLSGALDWMAARYSGIAGGGR